MVQSPVMFSLLNKRLAIIGLCLVSVFPVFSQDSTNTDNDVKIKPKNLRGFHIGLQAGTLLANKYTSNLYDGYGLDVNGNKNDFAHSFMYQKIVNDYGGGNGQIDRIAIALGVNPGQWSFGQSDMPVNLRYNLAMLVGLNTRFCFDNKNALILNVNASKLTVTNEFTISSITATTSGFQGAANISTFSIIGGEQRLMSQFGFQRILGDNDVFNLFVEGGMDLILAQYLRNQITINNLNLDLSSYYAQPGYGTVRSKNLIGLGLGAFAGIGLNVSLSNKFTIQLVYNPSYDKINMGANPKYTLQQSMGFRAYYNV